MDAEYGNSKQDTRERAVAAYKTGLYSQKQIGAMFGVHYKTIANWLQADAEGREQLPRKRGHLRRILTPEDLEKIDRIMTEEPDTTLAGLKERIGKLCSLDVYSRALKELGFTFRKNFRGPRAAGGRYKKIAEKEARLERGQLA